MRKKRTTREEAASESKRPGGRARSRIEQFALQRGLAIEGDLGEARPKAKEARKKATASKKKSPAKKQVTKKKASKKTTRKKTTTQKKSRTRRSKKLGRKTQ